MTTNNIKDVADQLRRTSGAPAIDDYVKVGRSTAITIAKWLDELAALKTSPKATEKPE